MLIDEQHRITQAFGGEILAMHAAACVAAREEAMQPVAAPFDIVVTTNSGYPLDQNLYQAVKGMSAAATVVAPGGTIICAAECRDGLPDHGSYAALLAERRRTERADGAILASRQTDPGPVAGPGPGAGAGASARHAPHRRPVAPRRSGRPTSSPSPTSADTLGALLAAQPAATVCVLPQGPQTIPYIA